VVCGADAGDENVERFEQMGFGLIEPPRCFVGFRVDREGVADSSVTRGQRFPRPRGRVSSKRLCLIQSAEGLPRADKIRRREQ
jgi:hypothetical protein